MTLFRCTYRPNLGHPIIEDINYRVSIGFSLIGSFRGNVNIQLRHLKNVFLSFIFLLGYFISAPNFKQKLDKPSVLHRYYTASAFVFICIFFTLYSRICSLTALKGLNITSQPE